MDIKPYTPVPGYKAPETEGIEADPEYQKAFDAKEVVQDKYDRIEKLLHSSRKARLGGVPGTTQRATNEIEPHYTKMIKFANYGLIGAGLVAGFMAPNIVVSLAIGVATMIGVSKGLPGKVIRKLFVEGKVDKIVTEELKKQQTAVGAELEASKGKLREAEGAASKRLEGERPQGKAEVIEDDEHLNIDGLRLEKNL